MRTAWPVLSFPEAKATYETLHLWTQIVGKIKLTKLPWINHSWHVTQLVTPVGLTTAVMPDRSCYFEIEFDLVHHQLLVKTSTGQIRSFALEAMAVADFYFNLKQLLQELDIELNINLVPNELEDAIPFDQDYIHATYEPEHAEALHQALLRVQDVFTTFRSGFRGKCSPVHFYWGGLDLAVSRFSGRTAPRHPGGVPNLPDWVAQEAYSHEVCSGGFWPGSEGFPLAAFYSYIYPEPEGYKDYPVLPEQAYYDDTLREFILPYEVVQQAENPSATLLAFLQSTYNAAADLAQWDRQALEINFNGA
ncbi:DUF5996 family protein [Botryobacter ruber]|uniref:DUF5996 family protein n=1 Tax=Botryobacter ruber TaxID=2171629 RepID=UPI000E0B9F5F|nr:DUF5996 family protein [Botryobacter ruber]